VAWAKHNLGGGRVELTGLPGGTRFQGQLLDGIGVRGTLHQPLKEQDEVTIALRDLPLRAWLPPRIAPLEPRASGEINWRHAGDREVVRAPRLVVSAKGVQADARGVLRLDHGDPSASPVDVTIAAHVDGRTLTRVLLPNDGGAGAARIDAAVSGTIAAPRLRGQAQFQGLTVNWPQSPFGAVRLDGPLHLEGRKLTVGPLQARFQSGGRLQIAGGAAGKGAVVLAPPGASLPVRDVDLTIDGSGITTARPIGGLSLNGLGLGVRLTQPNAAALDAVGWVYLGRDFFQLNAGGDKPKPKEAPGKPAARAPHPPSLVDSTQLHLRIVGPKDAVTVGVPHAPDVTVDPNCLVEGPLTSPQITGTVKGDGVYSRVALAVADWFTSRNLRGCDLAPR
jgi:hypothetical protein